ncbi:MAG: 4-hydroxy-3-methylbut-2-enyl diphosphate reductase [SAR324 cluster bacterium]|uniref:4-hydroxy-3-methylbut-2-enyl diphosphate reductase n=1 Tax=SAR324 cluster bacterium TaxID=2024889 RepID=A0A7X9ILF9_9DELT|nr:4-hydroxy-3-methylbut-2-enyl diphosphate reductase [SAR324 cluster bacterium]
MASRFDIPDFYHSPIVSSLKRIRRQNDQRKKDLNPTIIDLGFIRFKIARHFGFCFGVQNAIEIAFKAIREQKGRRIFLLSEMIHNPAVNSDLQNMGVRFIFTPDGMQQVPFESLSSEDVVIVPAFGTTVEMMKALADRGINPMAYNTTCPFVEKVWNRSKELGERGFTIVIHGKDFHEETKATFSHARLYGSSIIIRNMEEALVLAQYIRREKEPSMFFEDFAGRYSVDLNPERDLARIGIVNQTTMLAGETQAISDLLKEVMRSHYGDSSLNEHFADTHDTLCYATSENQKSVQTLIESGGALALVIGGYNSSNTTHLAKLCAKNCPTYHIKDAGDLISEKRIRHRQQSTGEVVETKNWLPEGINPIDILITAGASSPDSLVDECLNRVATLTGLEKRLRDLSFK